MKKFFGALMVSLTTLWQASAQAEPVSFTHVPFGNQISGEILNYNRARTNLATSGAVGPGGVAALKAAKFKTIIDLRTEAEGTADESAQVKKAGMTYHNISINGKQGIQKAHVTAFAKIYEAAAGPTLLHCASGNRAGALWTAYRMTKGIPGSIAIDEGRTAGMGAELEAQVTDGFCKDC